MKSVKPPASFVKGMIPVAFLLMSACTSFTIQVSKEAPAVNQVKKGDKFFINLPEDHTQQLLWRIDDHHNKACVDYMNSVWHGNEAGVNYNFEALAAGTDTLNFKLLKFNDEVKFVSFIVKVE